MRDGLRIFFKNHPYRGSHLPVLFKFLSITTGPVLELGGGMYSTPFLHWQCYHTKRRLVTYDDNRAYADYLLQFADPNFHQVIIADSYDSLDLSEPWSIAFVDNSPDVRRAQDIVRLAHADYVIAHDADDWHEKKYQYQTILPLFRFRWRYTSAIPSTLVLSNRFPFGPDNTLGSTPALVVDPFLRSKRVIKRKLVRRHQ
jgi:hypothetical protein